MSDRIHLPETPGRAIRLVLAVFRTHGWVDRCAAASEVLDCVYRSGSRGVTPKAAAKAVPGDFLVQNSCTRADLEKAFERLVQARAEVDQPNDDQVLRDFLERGRKLQETIDALTGRGNRMVIEWPAGQTLLEALSLAYHRYHCVLFDKGHACTSIEQSDIDHGQEIIEILALVNKQPPHGEQRNADTAETG